MVGKDKKVGLLLLAAGLALALFSASAGPKPKQKGDVVRLIKAASVQIITDKDDKAFRKAVNATFLHNDTYLICDTAIWRVADNIINAKGHVKLMQEGTVLTSETLDYFVDKNLAEFRGSVVQLVDKENNILRTRHLDYNTQDSVAVFAKGAAMKDKDGQIIESIDGTYDSKASLFTFSGDVNMYTDSVFIKTSSLNYHTDLERAVFNSYIDFWKDDNMLSASRGWYNRKRETFFFTDKVHATSKNQETWSDSLYYYRSIGNVELRGNVQLQDSSHHTSAVSKYLLYEDTLARVTMVNEAAVAITDQDSDYKDTLYFGADTIIYYTLRKCDIPAHELKEAESRLTEIMTDAVGEYRRKAAEEAARKAKEAAENKEKNKAGRGGMIGRADGKGSGGKAMGLEGGDAPAEEVPSGDGPRRPGKPAEGKPGGGARSFDDDIPMPMDTTSAPEDTLTVPLDSAALAQRDSIARADSLANIPPPDTSKVGFAVGIRNVKIYRYDMQVRCDSLRYTDLDSIARFYLNPVVWNEGRRQYYSDSLNVLIRNGSVDRASLMSNAMIVTQEDTLLYDQIKGAEVMAYFDSTAALTRFDAIGGSTSIFYLEENGALSTVNKVESKMLSGTFIDGTIDRIYYFDSPKNDAYPVVQFPVADRYLKGFKWVPELKPTGKTSITTLTVRKSERAAYAKHPRAKFKQTDIYFPGYIKSVYAAIDESHKPRPKKNQDAKLEQEIKALDKELAMADSLALKDSLALADSLSLRDSLAIADSLALADSLSLRDSLATGPQAPQKKTFSQKFQEWRERNAARRKARLEAREARWAILDARDAAKAEEKAKKAEEKARAKKKKELEAAEAEAKRDQELLNKYLRYYTQKKLKEKKHGKH
ncbi:MAG: hypothetical protein J5667_05575 [Bacteroidales bacterium]|nr:hypothetical protein [Bacteroidales bacterium]